MELCCVKRCKMGAQWIIFVCQNIVSHLCNLSTLNKLSNQLSTNSVAPKGFFSM